MTENESINCIVSEFDNASSELKSGELTQESLFGYFSAVLRAAKVDSGLVVKALEKHGSKEAKETALAIKINEGW